MQGAKAPAGDVERGQPAAHFLESIADVVLLGGELVPLLAASAMPRAVMAARVTADLLVELAQSGFRSVVRISRHGRVKRITSIVSE